MDDCRIVELYWSRDEAAIAETEKKYGRYCHAVAYRILLDRQDAEECVNDTYIRAWNAIPPHRPERLSVFLGKITRRLALNRYDKAHTQKRGGEVALALDELSEILADQREGSVVDELAMREAVNGFLHSLPEQSRRIFLRRYWHMMPIKEIAKEYGLGISNVKVILMRTRNAFKDYLKGEGIDV